MNETQPKLIKKVLRLTLPLERWKKQGQRIKETAARAMFDYDVAWDMFRDHYPKLTPEGFEVNAPEGQKIPHKWKDKVQFDLTIVIEESQLNGLKLTEDWSFPA